MVRDVQLFVDEWSPRPWPEPSPGSWAPSSPSSFLQRWEGEERGEQEAMRTQTPQRERKTTYRVTRGASEDRLDLSAKAQASWPWNLPGLPGPSESW